MNDGFWQEAAGRAIRGSMTPSDQLRTFASSKLGFLTVLTFQ